MMSSADSRGSTRLLLSIFFLSGAAALVYEVLWLKELGQLFGVTAYAAATTLAVFFLGLAAGGVVWGRRAPSLHGPLRTYALLEVGIAVAAVAYFWIADLYRLIYPELFAMLGEQPRFFLAAKFLLAFGVLFLPAFFMGGTLPVMGQHLIRRADELGRWGTVLYAVNTLGAATGALSAGFFLPPTLGFRNSYLLAIGTNLVVAAVAWWQGGQISYTQTSRTRHPTEVRDAVTAAGQPWQVWALVVASGFLTLALEVLWTRMFAQVLQNSVYTFAAVLTVFLLALALGSVLAHWLCRRDWNPTAVLSSLLTISGFLVVMTLAGFHRLTSGLEQLGAGLGWSGYLLAVFSSSASVLLLPGIAVGSVFPYVMKLAEERMVSAGRTLGQLAAANTLAAILGSLAAGFLLLDSLGLWMSLKSVALSYCFLAVVVVIGQRNVIGRRAGAALLVVPLVTGVLVMVLVDVDRLTLVSLDPAQNEEIVEVREGAHGVVSVVRRGEDLRIKVDNSYLLGTSLSTPNLRLQSWIPLALHPQPRKVFYLGMGTGITAGGALFLPVERVVVAELNPDVVEMSRQHFAPFLGGLFDDSRAEVVVEDGRTLLAGSREEFDVIIADIFLTYRAGVGSLYTREHFETVLSRLAPGGLFAQWLPAFELSEREFGVIARTMLDVFPQVTLWRRGFSPRFPIYALIGSESADPVNLAAFQRSLGKLERSDLLPSQAWIHHIPLAAYAGNLGQVRDAFASYPLATDDRPLIEYLSPLTHRESRGPRGSSVLVFNELAEFCARLLGLQPLRNDPFLAGLSGAELDQVPAGLAFYKHEVYRRLGRERESQRALAEYVQLTSGDAEPDPE